MSMKFYNLDKNLDLDFLEISTKLNLAYWIASDLYEYAESNKDNINEYEYERMLNQYSLAGQILHEADDLIQFLNQSEHKKCLLLLRHYVENSIIDFRIDNILLSTADSENQEIALQELINKFEEYSKKYANFLNPNSSEYALLESYKYLHAGSDAIFKLTSFYEFNSKNDNKELCEEVIENFMTGRILLDQSINNHDFIDQIQVEFNLSTFENKQAATKANLNKFYNLSLSILHLWREFYYINEQCYKDLLISNFNNIEELDLTAHNSEQYLYMINKTAIQLNQLILNNMGIDIPDIEIYSARKIKSPLDFISVTKKYRYN